VQGLDPHEQLRRSFAAIHDVTIDAALMLEGALSPDLTCFNGWESLGIIPCLSGPATLACRHGPRTHTHP
jgi:hypothetical protein